MPRRLIPAAICALGAHALLYGGLRPDDGLHGYLGWYEPVLAIAAIAAVVFVRPASLRSRLPIGDTARGLATRALLIVLVQESLERTVHIGHPAIAALTPSGWLVLVIGVTATAFAVALALRAGQVVFSLFTGGTATRRLPLLVPWKTPAVALPAARPLAGNIALRAPPALAR